MTLRRLTARVEFASESRHKRGTLDLRLLDASAVDVPARLVAQAVVPDVTPSPLDVELRLGEPLDPRGSYVLWAHWDRSQAGRLRPGDQLTTSSFPVDADDLTKVHTIRLSRV